jgi:hypothetical protein
MTAAYVNKVKNGTNGAQPHQDFNMSNIFQSQAAKRNYLDNEKAYYMEYFTKKFNKQRNLK